MVNGSLLSCHCGVAMWNPGEQIQQRQQPKKSMSTGEVGRRRGGRKKERKTDEKARGGELVESQQRQWPSQAEINGSDGSEHDEGGRWTNIKKRTPLLSPPSV